MCYFALPGKPEKQGLLGVHSQEFSNYMIAKVTVNVAQ